MIHKHTGVVFAAVFVVVAVVRADASEEWTLTGKYMSGYQDGEEPERAVFSPQGQGESNSWNVEFRFKFNGYDHIYDGTANGSLTDGRLRGEVTNERKRRNFRFEGVFKDGEITGRHAELSRGREQYTGTLTLGEG